MTKEEYRKLREYFEQRFDKIDWWFDKIERRFDSMDRRFGPVHCHSTGIEEAETGKWKRLHELIEEIKSWTEEATTQGRRSELDGLGVPSIPRCVPEPPGGHLVPDSVFLEGPYLYTPGNDRSGIHMVPLIGTGHEFPGLLIDVYDQLLAFQSPDSPEGVKELRALNAAF